LVIVYKVKDPRATTPGLAQKLFDKFGHDKYYDTLEMERVIEEN